MRILTCVLCIDAALLNGVIPLNWRELVFNFPYLFEVTEVQQLVPLFQVLSLLNQIDFECVQVLSQLSQDDFPSDVLKQIKGNAEQKTGCICRVCKIVAWC
jgi:hypothetical protein